MTYAIIEAGGKQIWIQPGKFYDLNYIKAEPGDIIKLNRVLLVNTTDGVSVGRPCVKSAVIKAKVLKHLKGKKIIVFKMKAKKNSKSKNGHRQLLTRLLIEEILN